MQYHNKEKRMGQREKRVQAWLNNPPRDAPIDEVDAILKHYFSGKIRKKTGSHRVVRDAKLADHSGFEPYGEFSISVVGGQRVKGYQLQMLARAIQIIEEMEGI
jgi:hypothetical protein